MVISDYRQAIMVWIVSVLSFLSLIGCDQGPAYRYQNVTEAALGTEASVSEGASKKRVVPAVSGGGENQAEAESVKIERPMPVLSVKDLLLNDKSHDGKRVKVSGKLGQLMPLYSRSFIINKSDDHLDIEFSYDQLSVTEKAVLNNIVPMGQVTIAGVWDNTKRLLVADELIR